MTETQISSTVASLRMRRKIITTNRLRDMGRFNSETARSLAAVFRKLELLDNAYAGRDERLAFAYQSIEKLKAKSALLLASADINRLINILVMLDHSRFSKNHRVLAIKAKIANAKRRLAEYESLIRAWRSEVAYLKSLDSVYEERRAALERSINWLMDSAIAVARDRSSEGLKELDLLSDEILYWTHETAVTEPVTQALTESHPPEVEDLLKKLKRALQSLVRLGVR